MLRRFGGGAGVFPEIAQPGPALPRACRRLQSNQIMMACACAERLVQLLDWVGRAWRTVHTWLADEGCARPACSDWTSTVSYNVGYMHRASTPRVAMHLQYLPGCPRHSCSRLALLPRAPGLRVYQGPRSAMARIH